LTNVRHSPSLAWIDAALHAILNFDFIIGGSSLQFVSAWFSYLELRFMFAVSGQSRKRLRSNVAPVKSDRSSGPLKGAVICLTGIDPEEKDQYHEMIVDLGGIYTRDLDVSKNTHLIAVDPVGAKYETAKTTSSIRIVQPAWLESCFGNRALIDELKYSLDLPVNMTTKEVVVSTSDSLPEALDRLLSGSLNNFPSDIFLGSLFYLLDFQEHSELLFKVGRIVRRGMGTVSWEFNDSISHVIVNDSCDDSFRYVFTVRMIVSLVGRSSFLSLLIKLCCIQQRRSAHLDGAKSRLSCFRVAVVDSCVLAKWLPVSQAIGV
jgi:hypothetical protein